MSLIKYQPQNELDLFDRSLSSFFNSLYGKNKNEVDFYFVPKADIFEEKDAYKVKLEIPGIEKDQIKISFKNNLLTINGEKKEEKTEEKNNYLSQEISYGSFSRSFTLPEGINEAKIEAKLENGILELVIPKPEKQQEKEISIKVK